MPSFTSKTFSSFYKNILAMGQSANAGITSTTTSVQSGDGENSAISLSDDQLLVKPQTDNTVSSLDVKTTGGDSILTVDTTNSVVKCGISQINALTQYKTLSGFNLTAAAGYHAVLATEASNYASSGLTEVNLGNGTDPETTLDVSAEGAETHGLVPLYWYLPDAITIVSATALMGHATSTDTTFNFHLMSYTLDTSTNHGDLSAGVVIADSGTTSAVDEDALKIDTMNNLPTDVAAGKVIMGTVETDQALVISAKIIVKYHIQ